MLLRHSQCKTSSQNVAAEHIALSPRFEQGNAIHVPLSIQVGSYILVHPCKIQKLFKVSELRNSIWRQAPILWLLAFFSYPFSALHQLADVRHLLTFAVTRRGEVRSRQLDDLRRGRSWRKTPDKTVMGLSTGR